MAKKVVTRGDLRRKLSELQERRETVEANRKARQELREAKKRPKVTREDSSRAAES
jgi:hypothetical protein